MASPPATLPNSWKDGRSRLYRERKHLQEHVPCGSAAGRSSTPIYPITRTPSEAVSEDPNGKGPQWTPAAPKIIQLKERAMSLPTASLWKKPKKKKKKNDLYTSNLILNFNSMPKQYLCESCKKCFNKDKNLYKKHIKRCAMPLTPL